MIAFKIGKANLKMGYFGQKPRSLCQIIDKACLHSRSHIFCIIFIKLSEYIYLELVTWNTFGGENLDKIEAILSGERIQAHHGPLVYFEGSQGENVHLTKSG